ncbi:helix-turn-helix domain-containing protein [Mesorhizobium sp. M00.F.Ca.ET.217.01.1.1]|uniref:helix-turn-helix domain-containing protein n=1 Tax=Mesorhizobium sp. M00.F.Ca.ET.217.01.1.1 TaxID=2500529 RepID=UPI000FDC6011|nr:helix-turn-helix domain-containing protein [Mesorhizobium sp. M00.F.Ca.ET.217.01.1.1]TGQ20410.1 DNA-binding protein [Mesorhizobium sp. M00.F.Ca.ET.217.01.1.1]TGV94141.1 DNA-binding protein [Mesorhizobium sp. M00.F.Ca.ET.158.01.1.1]TIU86070.1 MAG: helix-turn-helix domain-containing protein [Mesorhizobium sp.]
MLQADKLSYTISEFVKATGIARTQVFAHIKQGRLKACKSGRRVLIRTADAQSFLNSLPNREAV